MRGGGEGRREFIFFSVGIFSWEKQVQRKLDERYNKSETRYKEKSQVQRKCQANPPRDNKSKNNVTSDEKVKIMSLTMLTFTFLVPFSKNSTFGILYIKFLLCHVVT